VVAPDVDQQGEPLSVYRGGLGERGRAAVEQAVDQKDKRGTQSNSLLGTSGLEGVAILPVTSKQMKT